MHSNLVKNEIIEKFLQKDEELNVRKAIKLANVLIYSGEIYTDQFIIDKFPIKYKKAERLAQIKKLLFFMAMVSGSSDVKKNIGMFFTLDTLKRSGYGETTGANMHNLINGLKNCGIIHVINNRYRFGNHNGPNFSKLYSVNAAGIINSWSEEFVEYSNTYEKPQKTESMTISDSKEKIEVDLFLEKKKKTKFGSKIEIKSMTVAECKKKIKHFTRNTHKEFAKKLREYNENKEKSLQKAMRYKIGLDKVTARAYSDYIRTKKITDAYEISRDKWKKDNEIKFEYDISACVPRVSHLLLTGEWMPGDYDFYTTMLDEIGLDHSKRNFIKRSHMQMRFGKSSRKSFNNYMWPRYKDIKTDRDYDEIHDYRDYVYNIIWKPAFDCCEKFEGKDHSADVFYWESFIELEVVHRLMKMGITAYNVYDCFYLTKKVDVSFIESIIEESAKYVYKRYKEYRE